MEKKDLLERYQTEGFFLVDDILSNSTIDDLVMETERISIDIPIRQDNPKLFSFENDSKELQKQVLRRIQSPELISKSFYNVARDEQLLKHIAMLIGNNIRLERMKIHIKEAKYGSAIACHQDWAYQAYTNDDLVMVGIFLDDITLENGPIYVVPGSHKGPIYPHTKNGEFSGEIDTKKYNLSLDHAIPLIGKRGQIAIHHYRLIHFSPANFSEQSRRLLLLRYAAADAWPLMGILDYMNGFDFDVMKERIVLGQQTVEPRLKEVPVRMPLPYPSKFSMDTRYRE